MTVIKHLLSSLTFNAFDVLFALKVYFAIKALILPVFILYQMQGIYITQGISQINLVLNLDLSPMRSSDRGSLLDELTKFRVRLDIL